MASIHTFSSSLIDIKQAKIQNRVNSVQIQPFLSLLELCKFTTEFTQIHSLLIKLNLIHNSLTFTKLLGSISISPFADMKYARSIFNSDKNPNLFSYNVIIRGYAQKDQPEKALSMFYELVSKDNCLPNCLTFPFVFKACAILNAVEEGKQVHGQVLKHGLSEDLYVQNSLINFYSSFGLIVAAQQVFDKMCDPDLVSWNSMIAGLFDAGYGREGKLMFDRMPKKNVRSWNCLIHGYVQSGSMNEARRLFDQMVIIKDSITWNTMISGYVNSGHLKEARGLFNQMPCRMKDLITFNLMIDGYATKDEHQDVLDIFYELQRMVKIQPNNFTLVNVVTACTHLLALDQGECIERYISQNKIEINAILGTSLVNMFARCGKIKKSIAIFESIKEKDVEAWNSIIYNLGVHGYGNQALSFFSKMIESGKYLPDEITFINILSSCRHSGLVNEGKQCFDLMIEKYNLIPRLEHYGCVVDLLCRSDLLDEAKALIEKAMEINFSVNNDFIPMWGALLGASSRVCDVNMGEYAATHIMELDPFDTSCYVVLSNLYSSVGLFDKAAEVRNRMKELSIEKDPGCSSIEINGVLHQFTVRSTDQLNFFPD